MSKPDPLPQVTLNAIRGGWRDLRDAMGGTDRAARVCGVGISQVSTYGKDEGESLPGLAAVFRAEKDTGLPYITTALAAATNHILIPREPMAQGELSTLLCRMGGETGELFSAFARFMDDGVLDAAERAEMRRRAGDAKRAILAIIDHLDTPAVSPVPPSEEAA